MGYALYLLFQKARRKFGPVQSKGRPLALLVFVLLMSGEIAFVVDVINPATPTPLVWPRVVLLCILVFEATRTLVVIGAVGFIGTDRRLSVSRPLMSLTRRSCDVLDLRCACLR